MQSACLKRAKRTFEGLFNRPIGTHEQGGRHFETERPGRFRAADKPNSDRIFSDLGHTAVASAG
jgi:hypothetical protein